MAVRRRGDVRGRLERLEALAAEHRELGTGGAKGRLLEDFFRRALDAVAHVRRTPIDAERWRYTLEGFRDEVPVTMAAYVAALATLGTRTRTGRGRSSRSARTRRCSGRSWRPSGASRIAGRKPRTGGRWVADGPMREHKAGRRPVYGGGWGGETALLRPRPRQGNRAQTQRLEGRPEARRGELVALKKQARELAADVLAGDVETGRAAVVNQILNTLIRAIEQERKNLETGELAERLEAMEEVLKGRRTG